MGPKNASKNKTPVKGGTTQMVGEGDNEEEMIGKNLKGVHEAEKNTDEKTGISFNQEERRSEINETGHNGCANNGMKSTSKAVNNLSDETTENVDCTETVDNASDEKRGEQTSIQSEADWHENPEVSENCDKKGEHTPTQNEEKRHENPDVSENNILTPDKKDGQAPTQIEAECYEDQETSENNNFTSDKRGEQTQTENEAEWHEDPEVSGKNISIPDKRDQQTQTQDTQLKNKAVTIVLTLYGVLILLLFYLVLSLSAPYSPIHVPTTTDEASKKISGISQEFEALNLENSKLKSKVDDLETEIQKKRDEIGKLHGTVENLQQVVEYLKEKLPSLAGKVKWMEQEQTEQGNYILLFLVIFLLIFLGITYLVMRRKETQPGQVEHSRQLRSNVGRGVHTSVLDQIRPKSLDKTIGIVSFNSKTQKVHKEMLQRALNSIDTNTEIVTIVVDRTDRILTIHPSCLVFIFVDRNDRNIILEDPDSEIGDLRRLTTQCVMKMGASVVVVYVNDRESQDLHGRDLYNPRLQSVKRHPVLKELQADGRVFSVMDSFNQNQNNHISKLLKKSGL